MGFDDIVTTGLAALFGGALLWAAIGGLVGRFQGFDVGIATGMILFGLTGLVFAAWLAWILWGPGADMELGPSQIGMVGVFGAFGGFGALGGCVVLASELEKRRARPARPVSRARTGASVAFIVVANLVLLAVAEWVLPGDGGRIDAGATLFFLGMICLLTTLHDRWLPVYASRVASPDQSPDQETGVAPATP